MLSIWPVRFIALLLIIIILAFGVYTSWRTTNGSTDFDTFYYAAKRIVSGESVYLEKSGVSPYIYPPFFACLILPLTLFNIRIASFIWYLISIFLFVISLIFCKRLVFGESSTVRELSERAPLLPKILFIAVTTAIFLDNLSLLQTNILLFFCVIAALYFFNKKKNLLSGTFLAMAISIKVIPIIFLVYFAVKREIKVVLSIVTFILIFTFVLPSLVIGPGGTSNAIYKWGEGMFVTSTSPRPNDQMMGGMFNPVNQSITASISRWLIKNDNMILYWKTKCFRYPVFLMNNNAPLTRQSALMASQIIMYVLAIFSILYCLRRRRREPAPSLNSEFSIIFLASLFLNPLLKTPHLIFIIFPLIFLISGMGGKPGRRGLVYFGFVIASVFYLTLGLKLFRIMGLGTLSILILWFLVFIKEGDAIKVDTDKGKYIDRVKK